MLNDFAVFIDFAVCLSYFYNVRSMVVNDYLVRDLNLFELWNPDMKDKLIVDSGSIQNISEIPTLLKQRYKTAWEIKQKIESVLS